VFGEVRPPGLVARLRALVEAVVPRLLFGLACAVSAGLLGLVLLAPLLAAGPTWLGLFAHDATVRRTAVASALGLLVTACVFFRPPPASSRSNRRRPPPGAVGA
jgi:hypothetical protein